jgi:hypothetical protein
MEFANNRYTQTINLKRKGIVHYSCSSIAHFIASLNNIRDTKKHLELTNERDNWPNQFVSSYNELLVGIEHMLSLIVHQLPQDGKKP